MTASGLSAASTSSMARAARASRMPSSPMTATRLCSANNDAAAWAEVTRSSGLQAIPMSARAFTWPATRGPELLVRKTTRSPARRRASTASAAPGSARPASHTTPSRSRPKSQVWPQLLHLSQL